jgi:hypothetical protein
VSGRQLCEALGPIDADCDADDLILPADPGAGRWVGMGPALAIEYAHNGDVFRHEFSGDDHDPSTFPELLVDETGHLLLIPLRVPVGPAGIEDEA